MIFRASYCIGHKADIPFPRLRHMSASIRGIIGYKVTAAASVGLATWEPISASGE
jgi:hypothetical protein